ncbi:MAG: hypothetical protein MJ237_08635 [bacterium]|nr:hypothetical protein [bacterium]
MCKTREEIAEKYLYLALKELSKRRGSIKYGRELERKYREELFERKTVDESVSSNKLKLVLK